MHSIFYNYEQNLIIMKSCYPFFVLYFLLFPFLLQSNMIKRPWLIYALITTIFWGIWGALIELPGKAGFPPTLVYIVWALTMIPCALIALAVIHWKLEVDLKSVLYGIILSV